MPVPISAAVITEATGAHLGAYFSALADTEEVDAVALCDPGGKNVEAARKALGEKLTAVYEDVDRMLMVARPDLALVSVEAVNGPPLINKALEAGCHVFAEKPACLSAEAFAPLTAKAEAKDLHLMLALANRVNPAVLKAKQLIADGVLGDFFGAEIHLIADQTRLKSQSYHDSWYADKKRAGGGHLVWLGLHWLDLAMHLTGRDITAVTGFTGNVGGQPITVEDSAALALRFEGNRFGTMTSGYYTDKGYHSHLRLWGSNGWIEYKEHLGGENNPPLSWYSTNPDCRTDGVADYQRTDEPKGYTPYVRECARAAAGLRPAPISPAEGLRILNTVFSAYRAASEAKVIEVTAPA